MLQQFKHHTDHQRIRGMAKARALLQSAWASNRFPLSHKYNTAQSCCLQFELGGIFNGIQVVPSQISANSHFKVWKRAGVHRIALVDYAVTGYFITLGVFVMILKILRNVSYTQKTCLIYSRCEERFWIERLINKYVKNSFYNMLCSNNRIMFNDGCCSQK
jgi:hypothetical protein